MINWFPGHMNKTIKQMQQDGKICDCFLYVLDSRCPDSCINPEFVKVIKDKPIIYILNKSDLVEAKKIKELLEKYSKIGAGAIALNATISGSAKIIINEIKKVFSLRLKENQNRGVNFITRAMVIGVPNSGKSTIVNNLCGKARAVTGNRAGVTKSKQWIKVDSSIEIMDTPGVLLPNFDDENKAYNLAFVGSVKDEVLNLVDIACKLIEKLNQINETIISSRYGVLYNNRTLPLEILKIIGKKRGCLIKGGEIDLERASKILLTDFRSGKLGKIFLE